MKMAKKSQWLHSYHTLQCCNDYPLAVAHLSKFNEWVDDMKRPEVNYFDNRWEFISFSSGLL